jgi:hypothetical protein
MPIIARAIPESQPLNLIPAVDRATGLLVYIPEPSYRHALARGGPLNLSLDLSPIAETPPAPAAGGYSEPRTLAMWADAFDMSPRALSDWFNSGTVKARKRGKLWAVALSEIPSGR